MKKRTKWVACSRTIKKLNEKKPNAHISNYTLVNQICSFAFTSIVPLCRHCNPCNSFENSFCCIKYKNKIIFNRIQADLTSPLPKIVYFLIVIKIYNIWYTFGKPLGSTLIICKKLQICKILNIYWNIQVIICKNVQNKKCAKYNKLCIF